MSRICTSLILLSLLLASCARDNIVPVDNLPADSTITQIELENYINKTHIALLNRKPTQAELTQSLQQLDIDRYNRSIRDAYVLGIQDLDRSKWAIWQFLSDRILDGIDTTQVRESADIFQYRVDNSGTQNEKDYWQWLLDRTNNNLVALEGWYNQDSTYNSLVGWMVRMPIYDEINMGTENFVVSIYQHFYHRYPTDHELTQASKMVDRQWGLLYGVNGNSKADFLNIFLNQGEFQQGVIINAFESYLNRIPTTIESDKYHHHLNNGWDYLKLQRYLLTSSEFINE
ncbi:MAG: hypothetical protein L7U78_06860 [Schleiferiaceae bacterium]|nr:hypothetical protein [Schleiferiaceae bacterium]